MKRPEFGVIFSILVIAILASGCPKVATERPEEQQAVLLRYKFEQGRILKYRARSDMRMRFTFPFITEPQQIRTDTAIIIIEEVLQEPADGYAIVEQRIDNIRILLYKGDKLVFDSARAQDFDPEPQFKALFNLGELALRYEIAPNGGIRRSEGFEGFTDYTGPGSLSQIYQAAQPIFPDRPVMPGESWTNTSEIPLLPGKGLKGLMKLTDKSKLVEIRGSGNSRQAVIELIRETVIDIQMFNQKRKKFTQFVKGSGTSMFTTVIDLERGIVTETKGRISLSTSTAISDQPGLENLIIDMEGAITCDLLE